MSKVVRDKKPWMEGSAIDSKTLEHVDSLIDLFRQLELYDQNTLLCTTIDYLVSHTSPNTNQAIGVLETVKLSIATRMLQPQ